MDALADGFTQTVLELLLVGLNLNLGLNKYSLKCRACMLYGVLGLTLDAMAPRVLRPPLSHDLIVTLNRYMVTWFSEPPGIMY